MRFLKTLKHFLISKKREPTIQSELFSRELAAAYWALVSQELCGGQTTVTINGQPQVIKQDKSAAWTAVGIGAGIVGIGIPFALAAKKNADKAIQLENSESTAFQPYFKVETAGNGLALSYHF